MLNCIQGLAGSSGRGLRANLTASVGREISFPPTRLYQTRRTMQLATERQNRLKQRVLCHAKTVTSPGRRAIILPRAPINRIPKHEAQKWTEVEEDADNSAKAVGGSPHEQNNLRNINKGTKDVNDRKHKLGLSENSRTFHPPRAEYTFFSRVHGTGVSPGQMPGPEANLRTFSIHVEQT